MKPNTDITGTFSEFRCQVLDRRSGLSSRLQGADNSLFQWGTRQSPFCFGSCGFDHALFFLPRFHRAFIAAAELSLFFLRRAGALVSEGRRPTMPSSSDEQLAMRVRRFLYERRVAFEGNKP